ncbi:hypothetical protein EYF80_038242 [Liparis tanakae]|uniref:Secreted protein n=1 Tax=Liparis tanakae TaxID=230148 RepID=A0A4Z2GF82_9TELE|nr:hypothetical protein EYF80_038242 [Liparis tanakae]
MAIMKLTMLSMFRVSVCWMSLRRWLGNVWKVITSSASRNRINITSSVCASYESYLLDDVFQDLQTKVSHYSWLGFVG